MSESASLNGASGHAQPLLPSRILAGKRLCVVGGTGFLGKVWVSMLLDRFPDLSLAVDRSTLRWTHGDGIVLRGLDTLPVRLGASRRPREGAGR